MSTHESRHITAKEPVFGSILNDNDIIISRNRSYKILFFVNS